MADISYDSLQLNISANVSGATKSIGALKRNLEALQNCVKGLDFKLIDNLQKHLQDIANIDFSNVSNGLRDVVSAFKALNSEQQKFANKSAKLKDEPYSPNFTMQDSQLPVSYSGGQNWQEIKFKELPLEGWEEFKETIKETAENIIDVEAHSKTLVGELERAGLSFEQIKEVLRSTGTEAKIFSKDDLANVEEILRNFGYSAKEATRVISRLKTEMKNAGKDASKGASGFQKLASAFKRIVFYRVVRRLIQLIGQAIKEAIQNMALFDSDFNASMSNIMNSVNYLKNSLGTMLAPIIQAVEPFITMLADGLADIANFVGEIFAKMQGKNQFAKAIKGANDYAESLKKVKNTSLGIDELNVIQKDDSQDKFEMVDIEPSEIADEMGEVKNELLATFKSIFDTLSNLIKKVLEPILPLLKPILQIINFILFVVDEVVDLALELVEPIIVPLVDLVSTILGIVVSILDALKPLITAIKQVLSPVIGFITEAVKAILVILNGIAPVLNIIVGAVKVLVLPLTIVLAILTTIFEVAKGIVKTVFKLFTFDFKGIQETWVDVGDNIKNAWENVGKAGADLAVQFPAKANGGFVEDGFFFANHTELVGQFSNGKTAVANNEQITEGIYQAVKSAMNDSNSTQEFNRDIIIQIDGREIGRASEKYNKQIGTKMFFGGSGYGN